MDGQSSDLQLLGNQNLAMDNLCNEMRMQAKLRHHMGFANAMRHSETSLFDLLRSVLRVAAGVGLLFGSVAVSNAQAGDGPIQLKVVGGLAGVSQYTKF